MGAVARIEVGEARAKSVGEGIVPAFFNKVVPESVAAFVLQRVTIGVVWRGGDGVERKGKSALEQDEELSGGDGGGGVGGDCT